MHRRRRNNRGSVSKNLNNDDSDEDRGMLVYTFLVTRSKALTTLFMHPFSHSVCNNGNQMLSGVHGKR